MYPHTHHQKVNSCIDFINLHVNPKKEKIPAQERVISLNPNKCKLEIDSLRGIKCILSLQFPVFNKINKKKISNEFIPPKEKKVTKHPTNMNETIEFLIFLFEQLQEPR